MLEAHNAIRARMGVPPLIWSDQLAQVAQDWANHLIVIAGTHRPTIGLGQNNLGRQFVTGTGGQQLG
jgi:uncharacterized protein YkwD